MDGNKNKTITIINQLYIVKSIQAHILSNSSSSSSIVMTSSSMSLRFCDFAFTCVSVVGFGVATSLLLESFLGGGFTVLLLSEGFNIVPFLNELFLGGGFKWILGFALVLSLNEED